eukprot:1070767-Alexandrium_andersonii.AAC.1
MLRDVVAHWLCATVQGVVGRTRQVNLGFKALVYCVPRRMLRQGRDLATVDAGLQAGARGALQRRPSRCGSGWECRFQGVAPGP